MEYKKASSLFFGAAIGLILMLQIASTEAESPAGFQIYTGSGFTALYPNDWAYERSTQGNQPWDSVEFYPLHAVSTDTKDAFLRTFIRVAIAPQTGKKYSAVEKEILTGKNFENPYLGADEVLERKSITLDGRTASYISILSAERRQKMTAVQVLAKESDRPDTAPLLFSIQYFGTTQSYDKKIEEAFLDSFQVHITDALLQRERSKKQKEDASEEQFMKMPGYVQPSYLPKGMQFSRRTTREFQFGQESNPRYFVDDMYQCPGNSNDLFILTQTALYDQNGKSMPSQITRNANATIKPVRIKRNQGLMSIDRKRKVSFLEWTTDSQYISFMGCDLSSSTLLRIARSMRHPRQK